MTNLLDLLPHKPPMRLIDEVLELVPGERAVGIRRTMEHDFYFDGHFPGEPIVPAAILVEMLAQVGGLAAAPPAEGRSAPIELRVAGLGPFKFPASASSGEILHVRATVIAKLGGLYKIDGEVTVGGRRIAIGCVTLASAKPVHRE